MVKPKLLSLSFTLINGAGVVIVSICLLTAGWLVLGHSDHLASRRNELTKQLASSRDDLVLLHKACDRQHSLIAEHRNALQTAGKLPPKAPLEAYLQALARLTADRGLKVRAHHPHGERTYPGLLESRYVYEVSGAAPDIISLLAAIEETEYWCDVSYLSISQSAAKGPEPTGQTEAVLTLSLFSEPGNAEPPKPG